jgi:hypothetical protein
VSVQMQDDGLREVLEAYVKGVPRRKRSYAACVALAVLTGVRSHGEEYPGSLNGEDARSIRSAVDREWDRYRCARFSVGDVITVRCYCDDQERAGVIESFTFGASAPVCVRVDYPEGFLEDGLYEPINPSNYSLDRIVS